MRARDIMTRPVVRVGPGTPVREAIVLLTEHCVAALPVVDPDDRVLGIFTEADALRSGITDGGPGPGVFPTPRSAERLAPGRVRRGQPHMNRVFLPDRLAH